MDINYFMQDLTELVAVVVALAIPIVIAVLAYLRKRNETDKRTQVLLKALEKNNGTLPEDLIAGLNETKRSIKEQLLGNLRWGIRLGVAGLALVVTSLIRMFSNPELLDGDGNNLMAIGGVLLVVGIAEVVYYFIGRHQLHDEIEAEEKQLKK